MAGQDSFTKLLLHCNGADDSKTIIDEMGHTVTLDGSGSASLKTAQKKFGSASLWLDADGRNRIATAYNADFIFGASDFTIDLWARWDSKTYGMGTAALVNKSWQGNAQAFNLEFLNTNKLQFYMNTNAGNKGRDWTFTPTLNQWYHIAIVRYGANVSIYVDGTALSGTVAVGTSTMNDTSNGIAIGSILWWNGTYEQMFDGYLDEVRLSIGTARWTTNFTPPTEEYSVGRRTVSPLPMFFRNA